MNDRLRRYYERGHRCKKVLTLRRGDFPANSKAVALADTVEEELQALAFLDVERASSIGKSKQGTAGRQDTRETLQDMVDAVEETAEAASLDHPELKGVFEIPRGDSTDQTLIATARSFAEKGVAHTAILVEYSLPPTFVTDLGSTADKLETFISLQNEGVGARVNTNAAAKEHMRILNEALERLNVIFHNKYRDDPAVLAEWDSAFHLEAAPGSRRKRNGAPPPNGDDSTPPPTNA